MPWGAATARQRRPVSVARRRQRSDKFGKHAASSGNSGLPSGPADSGLRLEGLPVIRYNQGIATTWLPHSAEIAPVGTLPTLDPPRPASGTLIEQREWMRAADAAGIRYSQPTTASVTDEMLDRWDEEQL
eukprot:12367446-Heterocapsa_arctica.AAC.1